MNILAVIPARGGSKGIPRKNVRLMNGKPLISYAIANAKDCNIINDIVVTTDDEEIIGISKLENVEYIKRDSKLADDHVTLDPVIYDAVTKMENIKRNKYDVVITLQPTSPLLKANTLGNAIESFLNDEQDTYISVVNKPHLSWTKDGSVFKPNYLERLNRQNLPPNYLETGAFFITKRQYISADSRMGKKISVFEIPEDESIDIDSSDDWVTCEMILKKKRIVFRADGYKNLGMGHIYHCLTLAYSLTGHDIVFVTKKQYEDGVRKIKESNMPYFLIEKDEDFFAFLNEWKADIVVNDCLDTSEEYIKKIRNYTKRVVTIEDLGEGAKYADATINALYTEHKAICAQDNVRFDNIYSGEKYTCLRDEFLINEPKPFSEEVKNVLVIFGGTDPTNLTKKIYNISKKLVEKYSEISFSFIVGSGYDCSSNMVLSIPDSRINLLSDVKQVSEYMKNADLAITSQGRTVYELASLGIPSIVLAQNEREQLHTFAQMDNGFLNLGLGKNISDETIEATFKWLIETEQIRKEMRALMLKHDLKKGINRVIDIILKAE